MWLSNHIYNHCLEKSLDWHQPIQMIGHDLMYAQEHFGKLARMPVLIWRFFTPMFPATAPEVCLPCTRSMKMKIKEHMAVCSKLNMASSPLLYFQPQVVWEEKHRPSTNAWPTCCLWNAGFHQEHSTSLLFLKLSILQKNYCIAPNFRGTASAVK